MVAEVIETGRNVHQNEQGKKGRVRRRTGRRAMAAGAGESAAGVSDRRGDRAKDRKCKWWWEAGSWEWRRAGHGRCGGGRKEGQAWVGDWERRWVKGRLGSDPRLTTHLTRGLS